MPTTPDFLPSLVMKNKPVPTMAPKPLRSLRQDAIKPYLSRPEQLESNEPKGNNRSSS